MILPIYAFGQPVLKKKAFPITKDYEGLQELIENMWETMYAAEGVGIAAPQVGLGIRLFLVDTTIIKSDTPFERIKQVMINAEMISETSDPEKMEEGCLSIPNIRGEVERLSTIHISWMDENFTPHEQSFSGFNARVIQHEYDHIEGILFTDRLKPLKKRLIQKKLDAIKIGETEVDYKMKFVRLA